MCDGSGSTSLHEHFPHAATALTSHTLVILMKLNVIDTRPRAQIIAPSPGFKKKGLADAHLEAMLFCQYSCPYCSSNAGLAVRFRRESNQKLVKQELDREWNPHDAKDIAITYEGIVQNLDEELSELARKPGKGKTLVYSQLADGFSPVLVNNGTTRRVLDLLLEKTEYRIRVLTKNAIVGSSKWVEFFASHPNRFVVGLSTGSLDPGTSKSLELLTPQPLRRVEALRNLQDAGVPTYGMLCPVFPATLQTDELEKLVDLIRPSQCEQIWSEVYNERHNWTVVRACFPPGSDSYEWMTEVYEKGNTAAWSHYAVTLYSRLIDKATSEGWSDKLTYLLYEEKITNADAIKFAGLKGVSLQSARDKDSGRSKHPVFAQMQDDAVKVAR